MNCPHCQKELPDGHSGDRCPACGNRLAPESSGGEPLAQTSPINLPLFFALLFAPSACSFIAVALGVLPLGVLFATLGSLVDGVICTCMLSKIIEVSGGRRVALLFFMGIMISGLCFFLSCVGCTAASSLTDRPLLR
jgi:hypothetical protein